MSKKIFYRYSGKKSGKFWKIISELPNENDRQELYSLGCILQNVEEYVLKQLENVHKK